MSGSEKKIKKSEVLTGYGLTYKDNAYRSSTGPYNKRLRDKED
jgi:hypothetical protein